MAAGRCKPALSPTGWIAEFRIPLRTLRYGPAPQTWGVNFHRNIQRTRERTYWAPLERVYELWTAVIGRRAARPRARDASQFQDAALRRRLRRPELLPGIADQISTAISAVDAKFGLTPSLNLDLTYNTDFAQVEVDTEQINLSRFNLRFPEKRPFFLENSGLFTIGKEDELDLFFSRRIGLDEDGAIVPIIAGGRLTGKVGGVNVGVLNMQTDDIRLVPANNFSVMRVSRELPNRSGIGAMFVNRSGTGRPLGPGRLEPDMGCGRPARRGRVLHDGGLRGAHGNAGPDRARLRLQRRFRIQRRDAPRRLRVRADRRGLQSRGRIPRERGRLPSHPRPLPPDDAAAEDSRLGIPRMAAPRQLHPLRLPRWRLEQCRPPRRQPLGLGERQPHRHGAQRKLGGIPRTVRDLSRRRRAGRRARRSVLQDECEYRSAEVALCRIRVGGRPVSHRDSEQPDARGRRSGTAGGSRSTRRGRIGRSICRRARSTPISATCA